MQPTEFQTPSKAALKGLLEVPVVEDSGLQPNPIIRLGDSWSIVLNWTIEGPMASAFAGEWIIRSMLEVMGPGIDLNLPDEVVQVDSTQPAFTRSYTKTLSIPGNVMQKEGVYKLVVAIVHHHLGVPTQTACFAEGPLLQFYTAPIP